MTESQPPRNAEDYDSGTDPDAGPTWTAPPGQRPDGRTDDTDSGGGAGSPDAVDTEQADAGDPQP
jgi:hypothetical protein